MRASKRLLKSNFNLCILFLKNLRHLPMITSKGYFFLSYLVISLVFQTYSKSINLPFFKAGFCGRDVRSVNCEAPLEPIHITYFTLRPSCCMGDNLPCAFSSTIPRITTLHPTFAFRASRIADEGLCAKIRQRRV